jgi:hypothetical protein
LENLKEMNKFPDGYDLPELNQEDINYVTSLTSNEIETVIKSPKKKSPKLKDSLLKSTRLLKN